MQRDAMLRWLGCADRDARAATEQLATDLCRLVRLCVPSTSNEHAGDSSNNSVIRAVDAQAYTATIAQLNRRMGGFKECMPINLNRQNLKVSHICNTHYPIYFTALLLY